MNLNSETICGYEVSAQMKRVWNTELALLDAFVDVCHRNNLRYYLMSGTLLGAVRHKGFIPWDNDLDVAMPREDFDKLLKIGPKSFDEPFFFQTPQTESGRFFQTYAKICHSRTTGRSKSEYDLGINCGIFIDVFSLDKLPNNRVVRKCFLFHLNTICKMKRYCFNIPPKNGAINKLKYYLQKGIYVVKYNSPNASQLFAIYQKAAGKYSLQRKKYWADLTFGYNPKGVWLVSDWEETCPLVFEGRQYCVPKKFHPILSHQYGNYMEFPTDKSTHDYYVFDPDTPYPIFFEQQKR